MSAPERPDRTAPEGAACSAHPERPALATCPECGGHACIVCWHSSVDRCETCLRRNPFAATAPIPWEDASRGLPGRFVSTLFTALSPVRTAPAFAAPGLRKPLVFALLTFLPLAIVRGIIPFTHTLHFGGGFTVKVLHDATAEEIAWDVAQASGLSLLIAAAAAAALVAPYASLAKAYGTRENAEAPLRVMLYRLWLLPLSTQGALSWFLVWALPEGFGMALYVLVVVVGLIPLLLLLMSMRATARLAQGVGPIAAFTTVLVPLVLMALVEPLLTQALSPWLPASMVTTAEAPPQ